ncbi:helicase-related protein [Demequina mangrovi]|uniref:SNF2 family N-terminal domain-containing protein n=1 Tax=Demequina mangrovi TaxID=1043493 RepID=A0A1H6ZDN3_9MICO|nr:helicase-related protein [Demequina mangrovi]SEJ51549.1 SNF2 family N-terminal domain-containing protein [Demequina mangrovi]
MTGEFRYHPASDDVRAHLHSDERARLVVIDTRIDDVVDHVREARWLDVPDAAVPSGVYTFDGLPEPLVLFVPLGAPATDGDRVDVTGITEDHPLAEAWRWAEHWWEAATPVPAPKYRVNETVMQASSGMELTPARRQFAHGRWTYRVTVDGSTRWEPESGLSPTEVDDDPETWVTQPAADVARFAATLTRAKLQGRFTDTLFSFRATRTIFRPYQFKPVMKLLQTGKDRILIADEVGLGKTIEAGLVWTEMEARGEADRVLVVCPSSLLGKWEEEMEERFGLELDELDMAGLEKFKTRHLEGRLPRRFRYITSLERLRTWQGLDLLAENPPDLDLVIVDEAHTMRNAGTKSNHTGSLLQAWSDAIIFLTATPINLRQQDLYNLLELLVPEDVESFDDLLEALKPNAALNAVGRLLTDPEATAADRTAALADLPPSPRSTYMRGRPDFARLMELVAQPSLAPTDVVEARRLIADLNTLSTVITRTKKSEVDENKATRSAHWQEVVWTDAERTFYREYLEWCQARADAAEMPIYFSQQMPLRLASACLPMARRAVLDWSPALFESDETDDATVAEISPSRLVEPHRELVEAAHALDTHVDSKFDQLEPLVAQLAAEGRRALLFTFSRPTLAYLENRLRGRYRVAVLHGGVDRRARREVMTDFRAGRYDIVLASKVASEGLDFEFCSAIINYDLPWNPMEIEQRIGRIDRIGQAESKMLVASFHNEETIDERIVARVLDRIRIFEDSIGALEPIVNEQMKTLMHAFDWNLSEAEQARKIDQAMTAIEEQKAGLRDVADASTALLVGNDVDVSGLEDELERSGRYVGQFELAHLIADWAATDGAPGIAISPDRTSVSVRGNAEMAARVQALTTTTGRSRAEVDPYADRLRAGIEQHFALDQELARAGSLDLLSATHPLVIAATAVPGRKHVRFTHASTRRHDESIPTGTFLVALARAAYAPRGESELWATAVTAQGRHDTGGVESALLAALARGDLRAPSRAIADGLPMRQLAARAMSHLHDRHARRIDELQADAVAQAELRRQTLDEQHERKMSSIMRRIATARERGVTAGQLKGFEGMRRKAESRHAELQAKLDLERSPSISLEPIAVCVLEVTA